MAPESNGFAIRVKAPAGASLLVCHAGRQAGRTLARRDSRLLTQTCVQIYETQMSLTCRPEAAKRLQVAVTRVPLSRLVSISSVPGPYHSFVQSKTKSFQTINNSAEGETNQ